MIKKLLSSVAVLLFLLQTQTAFSQCNFTILEDIYSPPDSNTPLTTLATCAFYTVKYTIINNGAPVPCSFSDTIYLPDGCSVTGTSFSYSSNDLASISHSFSNQNAPVITVNSTTSMTWNTSDTITFTFNILTPCCINSTTSQYTTMLLSNGCSSHPSQTIALTAPQLFVKGIFPGTHTDYQNIGDVIDFTFQVSNQNASLPIFQNVNTNCPSVSYMTMLGYFFSTTVDTTIDSLRNYCNYLTGANFTSGSFPLIPATSTVYDSLFGKNYFPPDTSYFIHILYKVTSCENSGDSINFILYCTSGGSDPLCYPADTLVVQMNVSAGTPNLVTTLLTPIYIDSLRANYCNGDTDAVNLGFIITNNGTEASGAKGNARADSIRLYLFTSKELGHLDISSLKINGYHITSPGFAQNVPNSNTYRNPLGYDVWQLDFTKLNYYCSTPWGGNLADLNGDGIADDLSDVSGQNTFTVTVNFIYQPESNIAETAPFCPNTFLTNCGNSDDVPLGVLALYQNQCHSIDSNINHFAEAYNVTDGPGLPKYEYNVQIGGDQQFNTFSSDIVEPTAPPFVVQLCPGTYTQTWTDSSYRFICPDEDYRLIINLPQGYNIDFSDASIYTPSHYLVNPVLITRPIPTGCSSCLNYSVSPHVYQLTKACDTNEAIIDFGKIKQCDCTGDVRQTYNISCFNLSMDLVCTRCTSMSRGWDNISYSLDYLCDTSTCSTCGSPLSCQSTSIYHHCNGKCDSIGNDFTTSQPFTFRRQTLGWVDTIPANYYSCSNPPRLNVDSVAATNPTIKLNRGYPGDEVLASDSGSLVTPFGTFDSIIFQVVYTDALWALGSFSSPSLFDIDYSKSYITVRDTLHHVATLSYPNLQRSTDRVLIDGLVQMSFTFKADSIADTLLRGLKPPYYLISHIYLITRTKPALINNGSGIFGFFAPGIYPLTHLQAQWRGTYDTNSYDTSNSCDPYGASYQILMDNITLGMDAQSSSNCDLYSAGIKLTITPAYYPSVDFPDEFRPYATLAPNLAINFPSAYSYLYSDLQITEDLYDVLGNNHFILNDSVQNFVYRDSANVLLNTVLFNVPGYNCLPLLDAKDIGNVTKAYAEPIVYFQPSCIVSNGIFSSTPQLITAIQQPDTAYQIKALYPINKVVNHISPIVKVSLPTSASLCTDSINFTIDVTALNGFGDAPYPWLYLEQSDPTVAHVYFTSVTPSAYTNMIGDSNLFIMLNYLKADSSRTITITAKVAPGNGCVSSTTPYSIYILAGNECTNTPPITIYDRHNGCFTDSTGFQFDLYGSSLSMNQNGNPDIDTTHRCNPTILDSLLVSNGENTLTNPTFYATLPTGIELDSIAFYYPLVPVTTLYRDDAGDTTGILKWNLESDSILKQGLIGQCGSAQPQILGVLVYAHATCKYDPSIANPFIFYSSGVSPCNANIVSNIIVNNPVIPLPSECCPPPAIACLPRASYFDTILKNTTSKSFHHLDFLGCKKVLIIGTFTVDTTFYFFGCDISMAPNALIQVVDSSELQIVEGACYTSSPCSHVHAACDTMWRGIFVHPGSTFYTIDETLIEDADTAVYAINDKVNGQGLYDLTVSTFNKNYVDIAVSPYAENYHGTANNCVFTCRDLSAITSSPIQPCVTHYPDTVNNWERAPVTTLLAPFTGQRTYIGWYIDTVGYFSDTLSTYYIFKGNNLFDNLDNGIYALSSNMLIYTDKFQHITGQGVGIYSQGDMSSYDYSLIVGGPNLFNANKFFDCSFGVFANIGFRNVNISYNKMYLDTLSKSGVSYGIAVAGPMPYYPALNIDSNIIDSATIGIIGAFNQTAAIHIKNNAITGNPCTNATGIELLEFFSLYATYIMDSNTINNVNQGIICNSLQKCQINMNLINLNDTACWSRQGMGIGLFGDLGDQVYGNTINLNNHPFKSDYSGDNFYGIYANGIGKYRMTCNYTNYLTTHFAFNKVTAGSIILYNIMTAGNDTGTGMSFTNSTILGPQGSLSNPSNNQWVDTSNFGCRSNFPDYPITSPTASKFFVQLGNSYFPDGGYCGYQITTDSAGFSTSSCDAAMRMRVLDMSLYDTIARGKMNYFEFPDTASRIDKHALTSVIWATPILLNNSTLYNFNDSISNTSMGKLMAVDSSISSVQAISSSALLSDVTAINPTNNIETNLQFTAQAHLQAKVSHSQRLPNSQLNSLRELANKCPAFDGQGVFFARTLLAYYNHEFYPYPINPCDVRDELHRPKKDNKNIPDSVSVNLYPNPNNGSFTLTYNLGNENNGEIEIFNAIGMKVAHYFLNLANSSMYISNPELKQGLYIYKIYTANGVKKVGKITIVK